MKSIDFLRERARELSDCFLERADDPSVVSFVDLLEYWRNERPRASEEGLIILGAGYIHALRRIDARRAQASLFDRRRGRKRQKAA